MLRQHVHEVCCHVMCKHLLSSDGQECNAFFHLFRMMNKNLFEKWSPYTGYCLTHWVRAMHICVSKLTIIGSGKGLLPGRRQAIIWTNAGILLIGPLRTNFSEILIEIHKFSFKKMHLQMLSGKWRPFCLSLNVLNTVWLPSTYIRPGVLMW